MLGIPRFSIYFYYQRLSHLPGTVFIKTSQMKKITALVFFLISANLGILAQDAPGEINYYQVLFGLEKNDIVELYIIFDDTIKEKNFWATYDEYEKERILLGQKRIDLIKQYITRYSNMTDIQTDEIIDQIEKQSVTMEKLIYKYSKRLRKSVGSREAGQFYQVENYLLNTIRSDVLEHMPFIGEPNK